MLCLEILLFLCMSGALVGIVRNAVFELTGVIQNSIRKPVAKTSIQT